MCRYIVIYNISEALLATFQLMSKRTTKVAISRGETKLTCLAKKHTEIEHRHMSNITPNAVVVL